MSRSFFLENSGSHTQLSNQQHLSLKVTPVQFFFSTKKKFDKNWQDLFLSFKLKILSMLRVFTSKCFKKSLLARKLKTSSRKNFLKACTTSIWLTNKPYGSPSNRSTIFFWFDWKKSLIFWIFQKAAKTLISTLVDFLSIFTDFFSAFKNILPEGSFRWIYAW